MKLVLLMPGWWGVVTALACAVAAVVLLRVAVQMTFGPLVVRDQSLSALMLVAVALRMLLEAAWIVVAMVL